MYEVVQKLGQYWTELAVYLGYSVVEVGAVARAGGEDLCRQIQMFLRLWWMPDCGPEETVVLLNQRRFDEYSLIIIRVAYRIIFLGGGGGGGGTRWHVPPENFLYSTLDFDLILGGGGLKLEGGNPSAPPLPLPPSVCNPDHDDFKKTFIFQLLMEH